MLIALIAPRPIYIASAEMDLWANPRDAILSAKHAEPVYLLSGAGGMAVNEMPGTNQSITSAIGYQMRSGKHDVNKYDWERFMDFTDIHL
jgi:hypothetical protein